MTSVVEIQYPNLVLENIVKNHPAEIVCAIIYGSCAKKSGRTADKDSDFDFMIVFKSGANPYPLVKEIEEGFEKMGRYYDFGWFTEDYFTGLLRGDIDLCLWWSMFRTGDIVYAEQSFLDQINTTLRNSLPTNSFKATYAFRRRKNDQLGQAIVRNLHRIVIDAIWALYYKDRKLQSWDELPVYCAVVKKALEDGVISDDVANLSWRIERLRKVMEKQRFDVDFNEIQELWKQTMCFANAVSEGKSISEINDNLRAESTSSSLDVKETIELTSLNQQGN